MVAVKTHQAEAFLRTLGRLPQAILLYGSDAGLACAVYGLLRQSSHAKQPTPQIVEPLLKARAHSNLPSNRTGL